MLRCSGVLCDLWLHGCVVVWLSGFYGLMVLCRLLACYVMVHVQYVVRSLLCAFCCVYGLWPCMLYGVCGFCL